MIEMRGKGRGRESVIVACVVTTGDDEVEAEVVQHSVVLYKRGHESHDFRPSGS